MMTEKKRKSAHLISLLSLVGISFSAPLGTLALNMGAAPVAVGIWRMAFSVPVMAVIWIISHSKNKCSGKKEVSLKKKLINILSGAFLALHFIFWYIALNNTTIFNAAALVCLQPIYAMLGSYLVFKEKPARTVLLPLIIALVGSLLLIMPSMAFSDDASVLGNAMAALSGVFLSAYLMCGKSALKNISLGGYTTVSYGVCLVIMVLTALLFKTPIFIDINIILVCLLISVAATIFGHSLLNWSLPHVGAFFATVVLLGEPVGASIVAFFMFGTVPGLVEIFGGVMILIGIALLVMRANRRQHAS